MMPSSREIRAWAKKKCSARTRPILRAPLLAATCHKDELIKVKGRLHSSPCWHTCTPCASRFMRIQINNQVTMDMISSRTSHLGSARPLHAPPESDELERQFPIVCNAVMKCNGRPITWEFRTTGRNARTRRKNLLSAYFIFTIS